MRYQRSLGWGLPWELLYADDLVLVAESERKLLENIKLWKQGSEVKGFEGNYGKDKGNEVSARSGSSEGHG